MDLIFNNQFSIFEDIFYKYLTPKQCVKFYSSNKIVYNIYIKNNKFEHNYFTPKYNNELRTSVNEWCSNKEDAIIKYGNIGYWNTIYIYSMSLLFYRKTEFNDNIEEWNTSNVINMSGMFNGAVSFNQPLNDWNISNVIHMPCMFQSANRFNQLLDNWDTSNVIDMDYIFMEDSYNKDICKNWNLTNVIRY